MKASQLRDLTRKYASGGMSREEYLAERKRLIDAVAAGEETLKYRELDPENPPAPSGGNRRSRTVIAGIALGAVLVIAFATHFLNGENGSGKPASEPVTAAAAPENSAVVLLQSFNANDDWSEESLTRLETQWQKLDETAREDARGSVPYRRLKREVNTRIREHEALVSAGGDPNALMRAARLRTFSERLGFTP